MTFMMRHLGSECSIISIYDAHSIYLKVEGSRSGCMEDCDWLTPFIDLWIDELGPLGF